MNSSAPAILIVDDEAQNCRLLELLLRPEGYLTRTASSGEDAIASVAAAAPDLILLDIMMPGMNGYQVATILKADLKTSHIPIIMVTALIDRAARLSGLTAGVEEFLTKPVDRGELWLRVRNLLRLKAYGDLLHNHGAILDKLVQTRTAELHRFRAAMEISGDAILLVDRATLRYIDVNRTLCELVGYSKAELLAMAPMDLFSAAQETLEQDYDAIIADNESSKGRVKGEYRHKNGTVIPIETRRRALRTEDGWIIVCTARDVTERLAAERRLQELADLRHAEAARQAVILNALPANIALLDAGGFIVSVNEGWQRFAGTNALIDPDFGMGLDYLAVCDSAQGADSAEARRAAGGIRSVLDGSARTYSLEYPCHSPLEQRWFLMTVTPLSDERLEGAVIMHLDTTEQKRMKDELVASERRFSELLDTVELISLMLDGEGRVTYCNDFFLKLTGWPREQVMGKDWISMFIPMADEASMREQLAGQLSGSLPQVPHESRIQTVSGDLRRIKWDNTVLRSADGRVIGTASIGDDITDRKEAEARIVYLNRVYAVLSGINTLIVRATSRDQLFAEACAIAVDAGGFLMSLIALVDPETSQIAPVASAGMDEETFGSIKRVLSTPGSRSTAMIAQAIRSQAAVVSNAAADDPKSLVGSQQGNSTVRSLAALPLVVAGSVVGVLALYAGESEFFHEEELKLLNELAGDIAFAIDHIQKQEKLDYFAYYDALTGLANRSLFLDRTAQHIRSAAAAGGKLAVFLIDIERFKNINDSLGQPQGDELLRQVAAWLTQRTGDASSLARIGADHFALVLPVIRPEGNIERLLEKTQDAFLEHPFHLNGAILRVSTKVGAALFPNDGADADAVLKNAEAALKKAKAEGNRYLFYNARMTSTVAGRVTLETQLRQALEKEEFVLHYQPKINLATGKLTSAEALIRWNDPRTGLVPPGRFIPILEETGLIYEVGRWAMGQAIADYLRWQDANLPAVPIAVNVSPLQLRNRGFVAEIERVTGVHLYAAKGLELEITESLIMEDVKHSITSLNAIRTLGVTVAIDDFGTGFSSLSYLSKLPVDTLKIDRSFVLDMMEGPAGLSLVSTIIGLAHSLKLKVVAEGVETEDQSRLLRLLNCDEMQGFLFSKPVPAALFESRFLAAPPATCTGKGDMTDIHATPLC